MEKKRLIKLIAPSVLAIALSCGVTVGVTYALFTSNAETSIGVQAGKVNVSASLSNLKTYSGIGLTGDPTVDTEWTEDLGGSFANGGSAEIIGGTELVVAGLCPGDKMTFDLTTENNSNVLIKWRTAFQASADNGLLKGLKVTIGDTETHISRMRTNTHWQTASSTFTTTVPITIELPSDRANEYQEKECTIKFMIDAIQGNAYTYDTDYEIANLEELKGLRDDVNGGYDFANKLIVLTDSVDVGGEEWTAIGSAEAPFKGTFDGNNYEIKNYQFTGNQVNSALFGYAENFEIRNIRIADVTLNPTGGTNAAFLLGHANKNGKIKGINIDSSCSALSAAKYLAGLVCYAPSAALQFEDCANYAWLESVNEAGAGYRVGGFVCQLGTVYGASSFENCVNYGGIVANKAGVENGGWAGGFIAQKVSGSYYMDINKEARISFVDCDATSGVYGDHAGAYIGNRTYELIEFKNSKVNDTAIADPTGLIGYNEGSAAYAIDETIYVAKNTHAEDAIDADIAYAPLTRSGYGATTLVGKYQKVIDAKYVDDEVQFLDGAILNVQPFNNAEGTKVQRGKYTAGYSYETSQYIYKINIWLVADEDKPASQEVIDQYVGTVTFVDEMVITSGAYFDDPTECVDLNLYDVNLVGDVYFVTAK